MRKKKFVLTMSEGAKVHDLEELRSAFDGERAMMYFHDGSLVEWLKDRYYDDEADEIAAIEQNDLNAAQKLCKALDIDYDKHFDVEFLSRVGQKRELLSKKTKDKNIIDNARLTALTQEDLADLIDLDEPLIYLCGEKFAVPIRVENRHYVGVLGMPTIKIRAKSQAELDAKHIVIENCVLPWGAAPKPDVTDLNQSAKPVAENTFDINDDFDALKAAAEAGNVDAMHELAMRYGSCSGMSGYGLTLINPTPEEARTWYNEQAKAWMERAANAGDVDAMYRLAMYYKNGTGVEVDYEQAKAWMEKAAEAGNVDAMHELAMYYKNGTGVEVDYEQAKAWMEKAAEAGYVYAMRELANWYSVGNVAPSDPDDWKWKCYGGVVPLDPLKYEEWKQKADEVELNNKKRDAEAGNVYEMYRLAMYYKNGTGVEVDYEQAKAWMEKAAEAGNGYAMRELANWYRVGNVAPSDPDDSDWNRYGGVVPFDPEKSREWRQRADEADFNNTKRSAEAGSAYAMRELAWRHMNCSATCGYGLTLINPTPEQALTWHNEQAKMWMENAADADDLDAMRELADWYKNGKVVQADPIKAQKWETKIAEHLFRECKAKAAAGDSFAMLELIRRYKDGDGTKIDPELADAWRKRVEAIGYVERTTTVSHRCFCVRPASRFVQKASEFKSEIRLMSRGESVDAKSLLMVMSVAPSKGTEVTIVAVGSDSQEAVDALIPFLDPVQFDPDY